MQLTQLYPILFARSVIFYIGKVISLILFSTLGLLLFAFDFKVRYSFISKWAVFVIWWLKITCNLSYKVHGAEYINTKSSGLILCRHESTWETLALQLIFPRQAFVLKKELLLIPFFGWGLAMLSPISINRASGRQALNQLLKKGKQRLKNGDWVVVFPEGTRMASDKVGDIKIGGSMLAIESKADVYLVNHNAGKFWPKNSFIKKPGVIEVFIKQSFCAQNMTIKELTTVIKQHFRSI